MRHWKLIGLLLPAAFLLTLCSGIALAVAADAAAGHEPPRWNDFGWRVLNFAIFAGILWYFVGGKAVAYFKGRRQGIRDDLENLDERRRTAKQHLSAIELRIARLEEERRAILDESRGQASRIKAAIIAEAHNQAAQIIEQARRTAESEGHAVLAEVRATVADEIVAAAEKMLREKLSAADHEKLIADSVNKVVLH